MNWDHYREEIDQIKVQESLQYKLIQNMQEERNKKQKRTTLMLRFGVICMMVCALVITILYMLPKSHDAPSKIKKVATIVDSNLPDITFDGLESSGLGILSITTNSIGDVSDNNPWSPDANIKTLPVYENGTIAADKAGGTLRKGGLLDEEMQQIKTYLEQSFILENEGRSELGEMSWWSSYNNGNLNIERYGGFGIEIVEDRDVLQQIPMFVLNKKEAQTKTLKFADIYKQKLGIKKPIASVFSDIDNMGIKKYNYEIYEDAPSIEERIYNYNFKKLSFSTNIENSSVFIRSMNRVVGEKVGDYPLRSIEEVQQDFTNGRYYTNSPNPTNNTIAYIDGIYLNQLQGEYMIPFYRIYALSNRDLYVDKEDGYEHYGIYYIPAIEKEYFIDNNVT